MPQMSPMNWIMISMLFLLFYNTLKMYLNSNFKSKNSNKKFLFNKNFIIKW